MELVHNMDDKNVQKTFSERDNSPTKNADNQRDRTSSGETKSIFILPWFIISCHFYVT